MFRKKSVYLMAVISVLGWTTLAGAFIEDFESYQVHALLNDLPNWTTLVFGNANTEISGGDYFIEDVSGSQRLNSPRGGGTFAVINPDVLTLGKGTDLDMFIDIYWDGVGIGNGLIFYYQDQQNFYYVEMVAPNRSDTGLRFKKRVGGGTETIVEQAPAGLELNTEYRLHVQYKAGSNTFDIWLETLSDGNVVQKFEDVADYAFRGGQVGVWSNSSFNGKFDNLTVVTPSGIAEGPSPADESTDVPRDDVVLSWAPGGFANTHDVYFGKSFEDVNTATTASAEYKGNQTGTTYALDRLDFGQSYYWRVDEVNAPPDNTIFKGSIWSFTVEPIAYPIADVNAIASSSDIGRGPENIVDGSGLDDSGLLHGKDGDGNMWLSDAAGPQPTWIEFQFDKVYKLHEMWVWNYNEFMEPLLGLGFKDVTIEYSTNGTDYMTLGTTHEFAQAPGAPDYAHNTTVDFGGLTAKYVRLTANSNWKGLLPQYGLSEVRFLHIPLRAREPNPDSGATGVDVDVTLSFRAGREAAQHDMYLSTGEQAVIDGTAPATTVAEPSHGPLSLDLAQTYYWKVNEVNTAETPTTLEGDVWNFATQEYLVVDGFESYNDLDPGEPESNRIFNAWVDGYEQPANGSLVGYPTAPFAEQDVVHSSSQSMPLFYDNTGTARYSEAELTLSPAQDWTKHGANTLSLWFSGDPNNVPDQMYVKINGSKVVYDGDSSNLTLRPWQPWNIDLASSGIDLQNVTKLGVGFGDETSATPGGSGIVFFDDVRLYPYSRQLVTPAEPAPGNLVAHYEFEGTASDSSGSGLHGTLMGNPAFVAGKVGQAISLGMNDHVEITSYKGILGPNAVTVTAWINTTSVLTGAIVGWGPNTAGQRFGFRVNDDRMRMEHHGGNVQGDSSVNDGGWHHVAVTVQAGATISYPDVILYVDGTDDTRSSTDPDAFNLTADQDVRIGSRPASNDRFFMGLIDDVRIYDRALTPEEIAWLAGRRQPFDKPF